MWFKQIQIFQLSHSLTLSPEDLEEKLSQLRFEPCLSSLPFSMGWVSPFDEDQAPLAHAVQGYIAFCLQIEEKMLPASVVRHELNQKIKKIEQKEDRKIRQSEKLSMKDEITFTLLPRAFSKFTQIHAYIDVKNHWLILNTSNAAKTEQFISTFKKCLGEEARTFELKKVAPIMTRWLKDQRDSQPFVIEKSCVLQDPNQQTRIIRCQQQDLFAQGVQSFVKEGCEAKQMGLCWRDQLKFVLTDDFSIRSIQYQENILNQAEDLSSETKQQKFDTDFYIMTATLAGFLKDLLDLFVKSEHESEIRPLDMKIS